MITEEQKQKLREEYRELDERSTKLIDFMRENPKFDTFTPEHRFLLENQWHAMMMYKRTLMRRMAFLGMEEEDWDLMQ